MRVIIRSHWHPNSNGTEYTDALGVYPDLSEKTWQEAYAYAIERWEPCDEDEDGFEDDGPDVVIEEYIEGEDGHDNERAGGGSFEDDFALMEKHFLLDIKSNLI